MSHPFPRRVQVSALIEGRYAPGKKPLSWDERAAGIEKVRTGDGEVLDLFSGGGQSTPAPGWELLLTGERSLADVQSVSSGAASSSNSTRSGFTWTLYGISRF